MGACIAVLLWTAYLLTFIPGVQRELTLLEHRGLPLAWDPAHYAGGWGWAQRPQLHLESSGSWLLRDPALVEDRVEKMRRFWDVYKNSKFSSYHYAGEWALLFAALRLQGHTHQQILSSEDGLTLGLATMVAESAPPEWWGSASWLHKAAEARPAPGFRLGLLRSEDLNGMLARLEQYDELAVSALLVAVLRNQDAFTLEQRDAVLARWLAVHNQQDSAENNRAAGVRAALQARQKFRSWLGSPGRPLKVGFTFEGPLSAKQRREARQTMADFLRTLGHRVEHVTSDPELELTLSYTGVEFADVAITYVKKSSRTETKVRRARFPETGISVREEKTRDHYEHTSPREKSVLPSLLVTVRSKGVEETFALPPSGDVEASIRDRFSKLMAKEDLTRSERSTFDWCFENYALAPWRFGLRPYRPDWTLAERQPGGYLRRALVGPAKSFL